MAAPGDGVSNYIETTSEFLADESASLDVVESHAREGYQDVSFIADDLLNRLAQGRSICDEESRQSQVYDATTAVEAEFTGFAGFDGLSAEQTAPQAPTGILLLRPRFATRVVLGLLLLFLAGLAVIGALVADAVADLLGHVRQDRAAQISGTIDVPVPPAVELLEESSFAAHLRRRPQHSDVLHLARARLLAARGDWPRALDHFDQARLHSPFGLRIEDELLLLEGCIHLGRLVLVDEVLDRLDLQTLGEVERQRVLTLRGRLLLHR